MPNTTAVSVLPPDVRVKVIDQKSAEWAKYHYAWDLMHWLYIGGTEIESVAEQFLKRRAKELSDVYQSRIEQFRYQDHVGAATDYYKAALFEEPPRIQPTANVEAGEKPEEQLDGEAKEFYKQFFSDCDRGGTPFMEHARDFFKDLVVYGRAVCLVDLPRGDGQQFATLAEEKAAGVTNPYIVKYDPRQITNYSFDADGQLNWIIFSTRLTENPDPFAAPLTFDYWYFFDRQQYAVYRREVKADENGTVPDDAVATRTSTGPHALAALNRVPVIYCQVPEGLWLMNRAFSPAKDHLNTDNVLGFALYMAALAMPVVQMDGEFKLTLSEAGFIKMPYLSKYSWAEPEGKAFLHLASRLQDLLEQIYRAFYLISQARSNSATPAAASGVSKQQDMLPSKKLLNLFGDVMRQAIQKMYNMVSLARQDDLEWDVSGLSFPETPPNDTLDTIATAKALNIPSDTMERQLNKMAVDVVLPDVNSDIKQQMYTEIDTAPTLEEQQQAQLEQQAQTIVGTKLAKQGFAGV